MVIWNGQLCFGWVTPADVLRSLLQRKQAENPPLIIAILEYCTAKPSQDAEVFEERLDAIGERLGTGCERIEQVIVTLTERLEERLEGIDARLDAICERIEQVIVPLTEQNGTLRNKELDMHVVRPHIEHIIQTLNRVDDELNDESNDGVFGILRDAREADREEYRQLPSHHGVSAKYPRRGERFCPSMHDVKSRTSTDATEKAGRIRRVIHPAYVRERDGQVIVRAWVDVYIQAVR